jgi:hypothetical protein
MSGRALTFCISNKFPSDADADAPKSQQEEKGSWKCIHSKENARPWMVQDARGHDDQKHDNM